MTEEQKEQERNMLYNQRARHGEEAQKFIGVLRDMELQCMSYETSSRKIMEGFCDAIKSAMEKMDAIDKRIEALGL